MIDPPRLNSPPIVASPARLATDSPGSSHGFKQKLLDSRGLMLCMLFGVTAALGLPLLWKSRQFSHREKVIWSVVVTLYTVILLAICIAVVWWSYQRISDSLAL
jgi:nitrate reductase gamma subunit